MKLTILLPLFLALNGCEGRKQLAQRSPREPAADLMTLPPPLEWVDGLLDLPGLGTTVVKLPARMLATSEIVFPRDLQVIRGRASSRPEHIWVTVGSWKRGTRTVFLRAETAVRHQFQNEGPPRLLSISIELWERQAPLCSVLVRTREAIGPNFDQDVRDLARGLLWSTRIFR